MSNSKVVRKNLKFLPERFQPIVNTTEESNDLDKLKLDEVVGNL